jgi:adenylate cyclase class 2
MSAGPTETEIKIRVGDRLDAVALLTSKGFAEIKPRIFESNTVFDTPAATLRSSGCLLRLRHAGECILTFKGPALNGRHKTREEIEIRVSDSDSAVRILERLGFRPSFRYEKYRTEFARPGDGGVVTVDETPIGNFLEIEGPPGWIDEVAGELGLPESEYVTASYGSLYRMWCNVNNTSPSNMTFNTPFDPQG